MGTEPGFSQVYALGDTTQVNYQKWQVPCLFNHSLLTSNKCFALLPQNKPFCHYLKFINI